MSIISEDAFIKLYQGNILPLRVACGWNSEVHAKLLIHAFQW